MNTPQRKLCLAISLVGWLIILGAGAVWVMSQIQADHFQEAVFQAQLACRRGDIDACDAVFQALTARSDAHAAGDFYLLIMVLVYFPTILASVLLLRDWRHRRQASRNLLA
jgi:hypothetical protein